MDYFLKLFCIKIEFNWFGGTLLSDYKWTATEARSVKYRDKYFATSDTVFSRMHIKRYVDGVETSVIPPVEYFTSEKFTCCEELCEHICQRIGIPGVGAHFYTAVSHYTALHADLGSFPRLKCFTRLKDGNVLKTWLYKSIRVRSRWDSVFSHMVMDRLVYTTDTRKRLISFPDVYAHPSPSHPVNKICQIKQISQSWRLRVPIRY